MTQPALRNAGNEVRYLVPVKLVSVANLREHWAARAKRTKLHRSTAAWATVSAAPTLRHRRPLTITLERVGGVRLDTDNMASACKACRDGIADALGCDDGDPDITWRYEQRTGRHHPELWVTIEAIGKE